MRLSRVVEIVWRMACTEAAFAKVERLEPEHLAAAMVKLPAISTPEAAAVAHDQGVDLDALGPELDLVPAVLSDAGVDPAGFHRLLRARLGTGTHVYKDGDPVHRSGRCRTVFERARAAAAQGGAQETNAGHLFLQILAETRSPVCALLVEQGTTLDSLVKSTLRRMNALADPGDPPADPAQPYCERAAPTPVLDAQTRDLTREASDGKLGPVIGRRNEIHEVLLTLAKYEKNNPVLVGEAGVGKTAIVHAVAIRAAKGKNPEILKGKRILELNLAHLVGGTKYRGEFEERLSRLIEECRAHPEVIVFIDELHTVIGAGAGSGTLDAANILKPALSRGDLRCIGATTMAEYARHVESDPALERRFERIVVREPGCDEALEMLRGLRPVWKRHHGLEVTDEALQAAVDLSVRFDWDHRLPDKARDLVDRAAALARIPDLSLSVDGGVPGKPKVTGQTIAQVLSRKLGVGIELIAAHLGDRQSMRFDDLESYLKQRVIGQNEAIERVCDRLRMAQAALGARRGPLGVFLFVGPTGAGKTELARSTATFLFGPGQDLIRLDMSEYQEQHAVAKLVGAPPGYVGHDEEGLLTGALRRCPHSVVLLDEVEKAHPRVLDVFLQLFDEGRLTDSKGRTADGRHTVIMMTSNVTQGTVMGFRGERNDVRASGPGPELKSRFRPEFLNRVGEIIEFRVLDTDDARRILQGMIQDIAREFEKNHGKALDVEGAAVELVVSTGFSKEYGVRELRRALEDLVLKPLTSLGQTQWRNWRVVSVHVREGKIEVGPPQEVDDGATL